MRLLFEDGGRTGMANEEAASGGVPLWTEKAGALYAEVGQQNNAWWHDKTTPQPLLLRSVQGMTDELQAWEALGKRYDLGARLWAEAEGLALSAATAKPRDGIRFRFEGDISNLVGLIHDAASLGIAMRKWGAELGWLQASLAPGGAWKTVYTIEEMKAKQVAVSGKHEHLYSAPNEGPASYYAALERSFSHLAGKLWATYEKKALSQVAMSPLRGVRSGI